MFNEKFILLLTQNNNAYTTDEPQQLIVNGINFQYSFFVL